MGPLKSIAFESCCDHEPGILEFKGSDNGEKDNCVGGGFLLHCTASRASSPWYNFVSDTDHWTESKGATLCQSEGGIAKDPYFAPIISKGAKKIWIDEQNAILMGSPGLN